jgi:hypothetical protein
MSATPLETDDPKLTQLLDDVGTVLKGSDWTTKVMLKPPYPPLITKGAWKPATAVRLAGIYDQAITEEEAIIRADSVNTYAKDRAKQNTDVAAWIGCSHWLQILYSDKSKPYSQRKREAEPFKVKQSLRYERATHTMLQLQIEDVQLKIDQTVLTDVECLETFTMTVLGAFTDNVYRSITIYSHGNLKHIFGTTKSVTIGKDILIKDVGRLMPDEASDPHSIVHQVAAGFAPSSEIFDIWVDRQLDHLRTKYGAKIPVEDLEDLLADLRVRAFESKDKWEKNRKTGEGKISAKDVAYFKALLRKELEQ